MAKKKKPQAAQPKAFGSNPFNPLTGFAVSAAPVQQKVQMTTPAVKPEDQPVDFAEEMALMDVQPLDPDNDDRDEFLPGQPPVPQSSSQPPQSDEDEFLQALGELEVRFSDQFPDEDQPPTASARRMKQLKQGRLVPQASLDLHGLTRVAVAEKLRFFLQDARYQGWSTLLVVTGKGLNSESGEPVLRNEVERFLAGAEGTEAVAEWGRAPKEYGGDGALVLFLRRDKA